MKAALDDLHVGGKDPVQACFRHSMTVVFPLPLGPTIIVKGLKNVIASSLYGPKLRMPLISIFSIEHMVRKSLSRPLPPRSRPQVRSDRLASTTPPERWGSISEGEGADETRGGARKRKTKPPRRVFLSFSLPASRRGVIALFRREKNQGKEGDLVKGFCFTVSII